MTELLIFCTFLKGGSTNHHLLCLQVLGDKRTSPYISRGERARYPAESVRKVYAMKETLHKIRNLSPHLRGPFGLSPVAPWNFPFRERASESLPLCPFWMHTGACVSKTVHERRGRVGSCVVIKSKPPSMAAGVHQYSQLVNDLPVIDATACADSLKAALSCNSGSPITRCTRTCNMDSMSRPRNLRQNHP